MRSFLEHVITGKGKHAVVLATDHGEAFLAAAGQQPAPHVAVVGINAATDAPRCAATLAWMRAHWPRTRVLAIVGQRTMESLLGVIGAGVCGFVCRATATLESLVVALDDVQVRGVHQPPDLLPVLAAGATTAVDNDALIATLSRVERKVLDQVCMPDLPTWKVVAERLFRSEATIDTHRAALFEKLGVTSKTALVQKAQPMGFGNALW